MFHHSSKLQFPVRVEKPDPEFAMLSQQTIGGINGEIRVAMQYVFQNTRPIFWVRSRCPVMPVPVPVRSQSRLTASHHRTLNGSPVRVRCPDRFIPSFLRRDSDLIHPASISPFRRAAADVAWQRRRDAATAQTRRRVIRVQAAWRVPKAIIFGGKVPTD